MAPLLPRQELDAILKMPNSELAALDPESVRSLLVAADRQSIELPDDWISAALDGDWLGLPPESRLVHILPALPAARREQFADHLAEWLAMRRLPPDMRALWVSRIAPFVSSQKVWNADELLADLEPAWHEHITMLLAAPWPGIPWADVYRAHPEYKAFRDVSRPHERTERAPSDILSRWRPHESMAVERSITIETLEDSFGAEPGDSGAGGDEPGLAADIEPTPPLAGDAAAPPAPQIEPRRLQADVALKDSMTSVMNFVADKVHIVDVSIGRHARIRADAGIETQLTELFDETEADWIVLPVWFHAPGNKQDGELRVPRDQSRDSSSASFSFTAPSQGNALARIHVLRPDGGLLLQSALLTGDVVSNEAEARTHPSSIRLTVDVLAGDLQDPPSNRVGRTIITDRTTALKEVDGTPIEVNVAQLQTLLSKLVHEIETAANQHGFNEAAVAKKLVTLAVAGQGLRVEFKSQLGSLANANLLQIVSLTSGDVLPLELIYDGPPLATNSPLCATWKQALHEGNCQGCAGGGPDNDTAPARVCPMRFWSMCKVIERRTADARGSPYRVYAERSAGRPKLRPIESIVVAASGRVAMDEVTGLRDFAKSTLKVPAESAADWAKWLEVVNATHPELLIAMPHNKAIENGTASALMLGEPADDTAEAPANSALLAGSVTAAHVQLKPDRPGPVVVLLGCNTQYQAGRLAGFAGEFRENGAALTVGTIGELRADQAPLAARELLQRIVRPPPDAASVGDILLSARRSLLGSGMIMALLLVANGDAEWLLSKPGAGDEDS
jgi:hypothetical protein